MKRIAMVFLVLFVGSVTLAFAAGQNDTISVAGEQKGISGPKNKPEIMKNEVEGGSGAAESKGKSDPRDKAKNTIPPKGSEKSMDPIDPLKK